MGDRATIVSRVFPIPPSCTWDPDSPYFNSCQVTHFFLPNTNKIISGTKSINLQVYTVGLYNVKKIVNMNTIYCE